MNLVETLRARKRADEMAEYLIKESMSDAGKAFMYTLGGGMASAGVAYGVPAALEAVQGARIRANKDKLVNKMKAAHPDLKNYSKKDMDLVYNSLAMHAPRVLKDPLVGGQVMLEALRRGNHMDIGQLGNVSKMTGGSGITESQRDAANILAQQVGRGAESYAKDRYDSRLSNQIKVERVKGEEMRETNRQKLVLEAKGGYAAARAKAKFEGKSSSKRKDNVQGAYTARAKYRAYKKAKST